MTFCTAKLPRTGLANRLFPWARCKLFSLSSESPMLAPRWEQFKLGPVLRGESDWRFYNGLFQPAPEEITGVERQWLTATVRSIPEPVTDVGSISDTLPARAIVEFSDLRNHFGPLYGHRRVILRELEKIVRPRWRHAAAIAPLEPIGLHVRRGDFVVPASPDDLRTRGAMQTPIAWFVATLAAFRRELGYVAPAFVVSDGRPEELADLLSMPSVRLINTQSAISDLLLLARAQLLIASGGSSFSAWASFLGGMPTVSIAGQNLAWFRLRHETDAFIGEVEDGELPPALCAQLATFGGLVQRT